MGAVILDLELYLQQSEGKILSLSAAYKQFTFLSKDSPLRNVENWFWWEKELQLDEMEEKIHINDLSCHILCLGIECIKEVHAWW